jgi:hypothetical protein
LFSSLGRIAKKSFLRQPAEERGDIGCRIAVGKLGRQRGNQVVGGTTITASYNGRPRFIEDQHSFRKHNLVLLPERIPTIAHVTRKNWPADDGF